VLAEGDLGAQISARVSYTDGQGTAEAVTSARTAVVVPLSTETNGTAASEVLAGGAGNDLITGGNGTDTINGGTGNDTLNGGTGPSDLRDVIFGGDGNDVIDGGYGNDELNGGNGNDIIIGGFGADTLIGNEGNDQLSGGALGDVPFGGAGNDFLNGGFGFDRLNGGADADTFYHLGVADHGSDWVQDYDALEGDVLRIGLNNATRDQFQLNRANTANAGDADVDELFVIYRPTGQIIWALVDGNGQDAINLQIGADVFDLMS